MATRNEEEEFLRKINDPENSEMVAIAKIMGKFAKKSRERIKRRHNKL